MKGLYPIIRRVRRPLLPVQEPQASQPVADPATQEPDVPTQANAAPLPIEQTEEASSLPATEPALTAEPSAIVATAVEPVAQPTTQEMKPKRASNGRKAKNENA